MTEIPEALQAALSSRYDLQRVLGRGGMASVYLADDRKHRRPVAIKVLRPDLAASIGAERFLIEIEIAARLTHPHILPLHDSGEAGGFLYYVMPFIDGGSLRTRLEQRGRLSAAAALEIGCSVAGALSYAHRMGVVHRDIKPENILFAQELPIVADFGIAKAISTAGGEQLTRTGFPLGTPGYMSPEQAAGLTDLDARTDVYSLGVVCYEMMIGQVPGRWPTEDAVRAGRFLDAPPAHRTTLDTLPAAMEPALVRAMAIRHDQRTATPEALASDLQGKSAPVIRAQPAPAPSPPRRKFNDGEVDELIRRASELEVSQPTLSGSMTIGGIEAVAAEAGIDPRRVREAAAQMAARTPTPVTNLGPARAFSPQWWAGVPTRILVERVVEGELTDADCVTLIEEVRNTITTTGIVSTLGRSVSWVSQGAPGTAGARDLQVTITMRGGQTRIVIREGLARLIGGVFGGVGGGVGGGGMGPIMGGSAGGLHAPQLALVLMPLWFLGVFAGARSIYRNRSLARLRTLEDMADRLAAMAQALLSGTPRLTPGG